MTLDDAVRKGLEEGHPYSLQRLRIEKGTELNGSFIEHVEGLLDDCTLVFYGNHPARHPYHGILHIPFQGEDADFMKLTDLAMQLYRLEYDHPADLSLRGFRASRQNGMRMYIKPNHPFSSLAINTTYSPSASVLEDIPYAGVDAARAHPLLSRLLKPFHIRQHMKRVQHPRPQLEELKRLQEHIATCPAEHPGERAASKHEFNQLFKRAYRDAGCVQHLPGFVVCHTESDPDDLLRFYSQLTHDTRLLNSGILQDTSPHDSTKRLVYAGH